VKHIREDLFPHLKSLRDTLQRHLWTWSNQF
jgi:hypothetical protein